MATSRLRQRVNIAARLESLAEAGGICISGTAYEQVVNKLTLDYEDIGERTVKNISRPVRVYRIHMPTHGQETQDWGEERPTAGELSPPLTLPDKPSVAVLPFTNMSADPEQEYFSDGITEDIITDLSKVSGLFVIARNSVFTYKEQAVNVAQVGRDLGVRWILEGSIRKAAPNPKNGSAPDTSKQRHRWGPTQAPAERAGALAHSPLTRCDTSTPSRANTRHRLRDFVSEPAASGVALLP